MTVSTAGLYHHQTWLQSVDEIVNEWHSEDFGFGCLALSDELLDCKRADADYCYVVDSVRELGYVKPITCRPEMVHPGERLAMGDGHHRLAAAIDLGIKEIPVMFYRNAYECITFDHGWWKDGKIKTHIGQSSKGFWLPDQSYIAWADLLDDNPGEQLYDDRVIKYTRKDQE